MTLTCVCGGGRPSQVTKSRLSTTVEQEQSRKDFLASLNARIMESEVRAAVLRYPRDYRVAAWC